MKTMNVTEFKAKALSTIDRVSRTRETVVLTKRGKPMAKVVPYDVDYRDITPGSMSKYLLREGDIVSPLGSKEWESNR